jgi:hypothetical protein
MARRKLGRGEEAPRRWADLHTIERLGPAERATYRFTVSTESVATAEAQGLMAPGRVAHDAWDVLVARRQVGRIVHCGYHAYSAFRVIRKSGQLFLDPLRRRRSRTPESFHSLDAAAGALLPRLQGFAAVAGLDGTAILEPADERQLRLIDELVEEAGGKLAVVEAWAILLGTEFVGYLAHVGREKHVGFRKTPGSNATFSPMESFGARTHIYPALAAALSELVWQYYYLDLSDSFV